MLCDETGNEYTRPQTKGLETRPDLDGVILPIAMQIAARTIGLDLISVVPLSVPIDFVDYSNFTLNGE